MNLRFQFYHLIAKNQPNIESLAQLFEEDDRWNLTKNQRKPWHSAFLKGLIKISEVKP